MILASTVPHLLKSIARLQLACLVFMSLSVGLVGAAEAQPGFSKRFLQPTIGPGSRSRLEFTIDNSAAATPVSDLAFTDTLPAAVTLATPSNASTDCGVGGVDAVAGGSTIRLSDGRLGAGSLCRVVVDVTSSTVGMHTNVSGDLTSSAGNSGNATSVLTVEADRPGFSASFSPASVPLGTGSTLTFTIDNSLNANAMINLAFSAALPLGMSIADPSLANTTCGGGTLTASAGASTFSYGPGFTGDASLGAGALCTVSVDVVTTGVGELLMATGELTGISGFFSVQSGFASSALNVSADPLQLTAEFVDDPALPGGTATLRFTITNRDRRNDATSIAFTDDLSAVLAGLVATGLPLADPCGVGSTLSGTDMLSLSGGNLPADGGRCSFDVILRVPAGTATGVYVNTTSDMTSSQGTSAPATSRLAVQSLVLSKTFLTDPLAAGETVSVEFTASNQHPTDTATDIAFRDNLSAFVSGANVTGLPPSGFCGAGSLMFLSPSGGVQTLQMQGGTLAPGASCTGTVEVQIPSGTPSGSYLNVTEPLTAMLSGGAVQANRASAALTVRRGPTVTKAFDRAVVASGDVVNLTFLLSQGDDAGTASTDIAFTDDLDAMLTGAVATGLPMVDVCGAGSRFDGTSQLTLSDASLGAGESCMFTVEIQIPAAASPGLYTNTTSAITAMVEGTATSAPPVSAALTVSPLQFSKEFVDDPIIPGEMTTLRFTIQNRDPAGTVGAIFFSDNLGQTVPGLTSAGSTLTDPCGAGSSFQTVNPSFVLLVGGTLAPGERCTFEIPLQVPAAAPVGTYQNVTSQLSGSLGGTLFQHPPAVDSLILADALGLAKAFASAPLRPGEVSTLTFSLSNLSSTQTVTGLSFSDDLSAALAGLSAVGLPAADVCGAGSSLSGTSLLTFTGGSLPAAGACEFDVSVQVPPDFPVGAVIRNVTSTMTGSAGGLATQADPARANAATQPLRLTKIAASSVRPEESVTLTYQLENLLSATGAGDIRFNDDFDAVISGMVIDALPQEGFCGSSSQASGTTTLAVTGASLAAGASCMFDVSLVVPAGTSSGDRSSSSSEVSSGGFFAAPAATAVIDVDLARLQAVQSFAPASIAVGSVSTLTFQIDNPNSLLVDGLMLQSTLPDGLVLASPPGAVTDCGTGTLAAVAGERAFALSAGDVGALDDCVLRVNVTSESAGTYTNNATLESSAGITSIASAMLSVEAGAGPDGGVSLDAGGDASAGDAGPDGSAGGASGGADCSAGSSTHLGWWAALLLAVAWRRRRHR